MKIVSTQSALAAVENGIGKETFTLYVLHKENRKAWELTKLVTKEELETLTDIFSSLPLYTVRKENSGLWLYSRADSSDTSPLFERFKTYEEVLQKIGSGL